MSSSLDSQFANDGPGKTILVPPPERTAPAPRKQRLGERLINENLITEAELEAAMQQQSQKGRRIGETLIELGIIEEDQLIPYIENNSASAPFDYETVWLTQKSSGSFRNALRYGYRRWHYSKFVIDFLWPWRSRKT